MTAAELYEIVKDVPRAAWPEIRHRPGTPSTNYHDKWICGDGKISPIAAEQMFIGSMTNYLIGEGHHSFNYELGDHDVTLEIMGGVRVSTPLDMGSKVQTTTRLLASACKAVGGEQ